MQESHPKEFLGDVGAALGVAVGADVAVGVAVTDGDGVARQPLAPTREGFSFAGWTYDSKGKDPVDFSKPVQGGGDLMVYRTDLLEKAGIQPPKTWDEYFAAVQKLHDPANGVYGTALRGQRGSGANVWRWMPFPWSAWISH